jgi:CheY-like chemotaxis protein
MPFHVLVVDDEVISALALERLLQRRGYRVTLAHDGLEAAEAHERDPADLVVTDLRMPRLGGRDLIARLRAQSPDLPIVVATGFMSLDDEAEVRTEERLTVLHKPIDVAKLLTLIKGYQEG